MSATTTYESLRIAALESLAEIVGLDDTKIEAVVRAEVDRYQHDASTGLQPRLKDPQQTVARLVRSLTLAGPLTRYFNDPTLASDVLVKGSTLTATLTNGRQHVDEEPTSEAEMLSIITRLLADAGVTVDAEHPLVVHQIWNNTVRASVSIPPNADCLDAAFRIYRQLNTTYTDLVEWGSLSEPAANFLAALKLGDAVGLLVSGAPGAGKTTIVGAALLAMPDTTNVRIIQEARELDAPHLPGGRWSPDGGGHTIRTLVGRALQFGSGEIIVNETVGAEAFELIKASNSGCGFTTTLHAKSAREAMESLVTAALMAGDNVPERMVRRSFAALIDVVVHCAAEPLHLVADDRPRRRQIMEICTVPSQLNDDHFTLEPVFRRARIGAPMEFCGANSLGHLAAELDRALPGGMTLLGLCEGTDRILR